MLLAQYWRSFQNCAIFDCECGAVLDDLRHDDRRGGEKLMNCQRSDVLVLRMLVRPVKTNPGPALDRPLPARSSHPKAARLLDPVYAGLDLLPKLPYVELKQHLIARLRGDVGIQQGA